MGVVSSSRVAGLFTAVCLAVGAMVGGVGGVSLVLRD